MTEVNPYESPSSAGDDPGEDAKRKQRNGLYRDIAFTTVVQSVLTMLMAPPDDGAWASRAVPVVAAANLGFGVAYAGYRKHSGAARGSADLVVLMVAGALIFATVVWLTTFGLFS